MTRPRQTPTDPETPLLHTVEQAAHLLSISPKALRHMIDRGQIPAVRLGRRVRIRAVDLARIATEGLEPGGSRSPRELGRIMRMTTAHSTQHKGRR